MHYNFYLCYKLKYKPNRAGCKCTLFQYLNKDIFIHSFCCYPPRQSYMASFNEHCRNNAAITPCYDTLQECTTPPAILIDFLDVLHTFTRRASNVLIVFLGLQNHTTLSSHDKSNSHAGQLEVTAVTVKVALHCGLLVFKLQIDCFKVYFCCAIYTNKAS